MPRLGCSDPPARDLGRLAVADTADDLRDIFGSGAVGKCDGVAGPDALVILGAVVVGGDALDALVESDRRAAAVTSAQRAPAGVGDALHARLDQRRAGLDARQLAPAQRQSQAMARLAAGLGGCQPCAEWPALPAVAPGDALAHRSGIEIADDDPGGVGATAAGEGISSMCTTRPARSSARA